MWDSFEMGNYWKRRKIECIWNNGKVFKGFNGIEFYFHSSYYVSTWNFWLFHRYYELIQLQLIKFKTLRVQSAYRNKKQQVISKYSWKFNHFKRFPPFALHFSSQTIDQSPWFSVEILISFNENLSKGSFSFDKCTVSKHSNEKLYIIFSSVTVSLQWYEWSFDFDCEIRCHKRTSKNEEKNSGHVT